MSPQVINYIIWSLSAALCVAFIIFARRDLAMLFRKPAPNMGTGLGRIWAVARTCVFEALTARVWLVPIFWLVICLILCAFVRPFDESERISLYVRILLLSQTFLVLLTSLILACVSMPRDREKRIMITNASKPLSRLEIFLGKIAGFSTVAIGLLIAMTIGSYAFVSVADWQIKRKAAQLYELEEKDYANAIAGQGGTPIPPSESLKRLAEEGSLFAHNFISVPRGGMQIAGYVEFAENGTRLFIKGGTQQRAIFQFGQIRRGLLAAPQPEDSLAQTGPDPFFFLNLGIVAPEGLREVPTVLLTVRPLAGTQRSQEKTVRMNRDGVFQWAPDRPDEFVDRGPVELTVQCLTPDVLLEIPADPSGQSSGRGVAWASQRDAMGAGAVMIAAQPNPRIIGFEKRGKQQVSGPDPKKPNDAIRVARDQSVFRFSGKSLPSIPVNSKGEFAVSMVLDIEKTANQTQDTFALVEAYNIDNRRERAIKTVQVIEKRTTTVSLPSTLLGSGDNRGDLYIHVSCITPGHWLAFNESSVRIEQPRTPFLVNLIKSELIILFEAVLLIIIAVTCSIRLGWPVAALTSIAAFILGNFLDFIRSFLEYSGLSLFGITVDQNAGGVTKFFDALATLFFKIIYFFANLLPDFTRFDALAFIVDSRNMPWFNVGFSFVVAIIYALPFIAIGYLLIRKQELG